MGYGVVEAEGGRLAALDFGAISTPAGEPPAERLRSLYERLSAIVRMWRPDRMAVETVFFRRNVTSALAVAQARGVALLVAAQSGVPVAEFSPQAVKLAVSGEGRAGKEQVQWMVRALLGLREAPRPDDAADALALAICALETATAAARGWRA